MNGVELAAHYAFPPNSFGYCGGRNFRRILQSGDGKALGREMKKFRVHYAYLSLIARENGLEPFDKKVVEAFWIGNRLLENVSGESIRRFIRRDLFRNKSSRAKSLAKNLPEGILPHHSFNPLYINFVTGSVARTIKNYDSCCVTAGRVLSVSERSALVRRFSIAWNGAFCIRKRKDRVVLARNGIRLAGHVKTGDIVSVHWGMAVRKLRPKDYKALEKYTLSNIRACNDASKSNH